MPAAMTQSAYDLLYFLEESFWVCTLAFALWRGDATVRQAALAVLVPGLPTWAAWVNPAWRVAVPWLEALCLLWLAAVAVRRPRGWLLWTCAFQLAGVAGHLAHALDPRIGTLAFQTANNTWWMLGTATLLWGAVEADARRRRADDEGVRA
jgi:hypothetical protein